MTQLTWACREHLFLLLQGPSPSLLQATRTATLPHPHHGAVPSLTGKPACYSRQCRRLQELHTAHELGTVSYSCFQSVTFHMVHIRGTRERNRVS